MDRSPTTVGRATEDPETQTGPDVVDFPTEPTLVVGPRHAVAAQLPIFRPR